MSRLFIFFDIINLYNGGRGIIMKKFWSLFLIIVLLLSTACQSSATMQVKSNNTSANPEQDKTQGENINIATEQPIKPEIIIDENANENGKIMILMYHGIGDEEKEWVRTSANFRKDLETLYSKGYRLISLMDYVNNNIKVEAGYTPVVITFDDGLLNQFNIIEENGIKKIDPDCAVGMLEDFYKEHKDFGRAASFYIYYPVPFRQKELIKEKFEFLINNGYEIGNHSYNHPSLGKIALEEVDEQLAMNVKSTKDYVPDYVVESLALPFGEAPKGENYSHVVSGAYEGVEYLNKAVLKVGSNPALSPNNKDFDPLKLPRVRASELNTAGTGIYDWLTYFEKNPDKRYISDGNPDVVTVPSTEEANIDKDKLLGKELRMYNK